MSKNNISPYVEQLATLLIKNNKRLTLAESCTGGWIAKLLTDLAGSSVWFERGFVTYSNESKQEMLNVSATTLENHGAVSNQTVIEMALGAIKSSHADYSLSVSGIAGPGGGSESKPVGLVWFAIAFQDTVIFSGEKFFAGDRNAVREQAVEYGLKILIDHL